MKNIIKNILSCTLVAAFLSVGMTAVAQKIDTSLTDNTTAQVEDGTISKITLPCAKTEA